VDTALRNKAEFQMPVKTRMNQENGDYYAVMPCLYPKENLAIVKMIGRHLPKPEEERTTMMSDMLIYEADTGVLKAVMDAEYITTLRTGASAAHSALLYARSDFKTVGLIGLGNIMSACMDVFFEKTKDRTLVVKLYRHHNQEIRFKERYKNYSNVTFELCDTYERTIKGSDIVISALTRAEYNFCSNDCYDEGCTVIPIMTLGFQNCDLFFDHVFTDEIEQIKGFKYYKSFKAITNTTDVLLGKKQGRTSDKDRILVYNYGLAIHDLYFAAQVLKLARDTGYVNYNYCTDKYFM
jgi:ornithine cyclodeaminase/alanine dehydrogenase-like protein (mu-crystallin family)